MGEEQYYELIAAWDQVSDAIKKVETSQPFQMTEAAANLVFARHRFDAVVRSHGRVKP